MIEAQAFTYYPEAKTYVAEASSLRWPPGQFARKINVDGVEVQMLEVVRTQEGDIAYVRYGVPGTLPQFHVYND